jgi:hypothetical protein
MWGISRSHGRHNNTTKPCSISVDLVPHALDPAQENNISRKQNRNLSLDLSNPGELGNEALYELGTKYVRKKNLKNLQHKTKLFGGLLKTISEEEEEEEEALSMKLNQNESSSCRIKKTM